MGLGEVFSELLISTYLYLVLVALTTVTAETELGRRYDMARRRTTVTVSESDRADDQSRSPTRF